jgi:hypothetical protein
MRAAWCVLIAGWLTVVGAVFSAPRVAARPLQQAATDVPPSISSQRALLDRYCVTCHNEKLKTAGLALDALDVANPGVDAPAWESVVRKLRGGAMPPVGRPRPDKATSDGFVAWLEAELDRAAAARPNPGRTEAFHRLNRAEYRNAVGDVLGVDVDVAALLPPDDASYGFDNIAGVLRFSPTLMDRYLAAAKKISPIAIGRPPSVPNSELFRLSDDLPQDDRIEDLPFGTRGGTLIQYNFPADGEYVVRVRLARQLGMNDINIPNYALPQELEVSLDGEPLKVFTLPATVPAPSRRRMPAQSSSPGAPESAPAAAASDNAQQQAPPAAPLVPAARRDRNELDVDWEVRFSAKAGTRDLAVTFINRTSALLETLIEPYLYPYAAGSRNLASRKGAYLRSVEVMGPFNAAGTADTASRRRIFVCRPTSVSELRCAKTILSTLARRAYRRPVADADLQGLLSSYAEGRAEGGFEAGIELAIRRLLVSPEFLFRTQAVPPRVAPDTNYRIPDLELASRLSFFLWSSVPDEELLDVAARGRLRDPAVLERQVRRLLADPRSQALVENFVGQWLQLRNIRALGPDPFKDPDFDESLRQALRGETELFFESIMREDRSVVELLSANYTFLNERLAKHYGIPHVYGSHFRRVTLPEGSVRGGLLGQGSILAVTSHANRTSPPVRGKWILENILGTPPPAPPPNVPVLEEKKDAGQALTMRERIAEHRTNPTCASCHVIMDPLGLALENFDHAGRWRTVEEGFDSRLASFTPIDSAGALPDGTTFDGPLELRAVLVSRADTFVHTLTEKLLTYALGRGLESYDMPAVRAITREMAGQDYRFTSLVLGIVKSLPFQMRRSPAEGPASPTTASAHR